LKRGQRFKERRLFGSPEGARPHFDNFYPWPFNFLIVSRGALRYNKVEEAEMKRRVLIPLDGSPVAEGIIPFSLGIAGPLDMEIVLLRVVTPALPQADATAPRVIVEDLAVRTAEARDYLAAIAADLMSRGLRVRTRVRSGAPVTEILAAARESAADLIAMTTHGRGGLSRLVFGSVAEAVLRLAESPILLMRLTAAEAHVLAGYGRAAHVSAA
jgi:nucleotide-binding universal stress UspA family protein